MRTDKNLAFLLRSQGKSYKQISKELRVAVSTLSNWFKGADFSEAIRKKLTKNAIATSTIRLESLNKKRGTILSMLYERAEIEAIHEIKKYLNNPLFVTAIASYWGEGDKNTKNQVRLTNTDPMMLKIFVKFLIKICKIKKENIRIALFIYKDLDDDASRRYWSSYTGIDTFHKTMVLPSLHKTKRLPYGICTVIVSNSYLKKKMTVWIDRLPKIILNEALKIK